MNNTLTIDIIEEMYENLNKSNSLKNLKIYQSEFLEEQFRFPKSKKRRICKKWYNKKENWRPITDRAFKFSDECIVCHPVFAERIENEYRITLD